MVGVGGLTRAPHLTSRQLSSHHLGSPSVVAEKSKKKFSNYLDTITQQPRRNPALQALEATGFHGAYQLARVGNSHAMGAAFGGKTDVALSHLSSVASIAVADS